MQSSSARRFLRRLIDPVASTRATAANALEHDYFFSCKADLDLLYNVTFSGA